MGRAYQCIFWDIPIRSLLWHEDWMTAVVSGGLGLTWEEYLKHPDANQVIQRIVIMLGIVLLFCAIVALANFKKGFTRLSAYTSFLILIFIAFLYHLEKFQTAGQFFEYSLQFMTPLIFWFYVKNGITNQWVLLLKICVALTFVSHGLYALGFYPVPSNFVSMTMHILPVNQATAISILLLAGILDLIFSVGLFLKGWVFKGSVLYCIVWGGLTTAARILANVDFSMFGRTMHQWWFESMYRLPHFIIPIVLYLVWKAQKHIALTEKG